MYYFEKKEYIYYSHTINIFVLIFNFIRLKSCILSDYLLNMFNKFSVSDIFVYIGWDPSSRKYVHVAANSEQNLICSVILIKINTFNMNVQPAGYC